MSHFISSHYASSHHASSHFGGAAVLEEFGGHSGPDFDRKGRKQQFPVVDAEYYQRQKQVDEDVSLIAMMLVAVEDDEW